MSNPRGVRWSAVAIVAALAGGCSEGRDELPTWDEFRADAMRERIVDGVAQRFYVVEGD